MFGQNKVLLQFVFGLPLTHEIKIEDTSICFESHVGTYREDLCDRGPWTPSQACTRLYFIFLP